MARVQKKELEQDQLKVKISTQPLISFSFFTSLGLIRKRSVLLYTLLTVKASRVGIFNCLLCFLRALCFALLSCLLSSHIFGASYSWTRFIRKCVSFDSKLFEAHRYAITNYPFISNLWVVRNNLILCMNVKYSSVLSCKSKNWQFVECCTVEPLV